MPKEHPEKSPYFLQSLAKGLTVLQIMAEAPQPLSLTEISLKAGISNTTTTRCIHTLTSMEFVRRDHHRRYHLTPKVLALGYTAVARLGWRKVAQHYMELLSQEIGETVNLSVRDGKEILYIARIKTENILPYDLQIGSKLPLHCTSMGKAMMAFTPMDQALPIIDSLEWEALTHRTITLKEAYLDELDKVRNQGYAVNDEELSVGLRSVAAPILTENGWAMAAVNIAVETKKFSQSELEIKLAPLLMMTAREIERAIQSMNRGNK